MSIIRSWFDHTLRIQVNILKVTPSRRGYMASLKQKIANWFGYQIWQDKCWGKILHKFQDQNINASILQVNKGWQCSIHKHEHRYNAFISTTALIAIEVWSKNTNPAIIPSSMPMVTHYLSPGQHYVVAPQTYHRFFVLSAGEVLEIYWTASNQTCSIDDIYRLTEGGPLLHQPAIRISD